MMKKLSLTPTNVLLAAGLVILGVSARLLPHPANFAPIGAIAIFSGAFLPRKLAAWVPVAAVMLSDVTLGFYQIMPVIWATYAIVALASSYVLARRSFARVAAVTISGSVLFFVTTNLAVWVWGGMYAHSLAGLVQCYAMAIPFFRNTVASDAVFTAALFGGYALVRRWHSQRQSRLATVAGQ